MVKVGKNNKICFLNFASLGFIRIILQTDWVCPENGLG